ncbi:FitA-like ribbon-helix-helix domain-containing protein [Spirochaeta africana]|uniref:Antitoxin FitA-like ribbon-helix-helix domain-containing protein n=1 Tax=Spirochaeta africana (strain ATCC 700263 / DSM 8902 / Z-7692) TaxID=889378 RepID=H9UGA0_SPIAZ|nr:plasmid stabilization protein [Spirochaeta africana]AFG36543.1 hypothetical protein Spiaf_0439 [Spirochaeta africana DSM 8902]
MATLTIRNLDARVKQQLRRRAAEHQNSMEEEVRQILSDVLSREPSPEENLAERIHTRFAAVGGIDLPPPDRTDLPREPGF